MHFGKSRKLSKGEKKGLFYSIAEYLYRRLWSGKYLLHYAAHVDLDLKTLYPCGNQMQIREEYYVKKISLSLMLVFFGTVLVGLLGIKSKMELALGEDASITRGSSGQVREITLNASFEGEEEALSFENFIIQVAPKQMTEEELLPVLAEFEKELPTLILGNNSSLEQVWGDLVLLEEYEGYPFFVEWHSDRPELVSGTGKVYGGEGKEEVMLTAEISYGSFVREKEIPVMAGPPVKTAKEQAYEKLEAFLKASEQAERTQEEWILPALWQGKKVEWQQVGEDYGLPLWTITIFCAVAVYFLSDWDLHEKTQEQKKQMQREYPDILHKLALYLGAGMTVRGAFGKVAAEFPADAAHPAYREMQHTFRELQAGVSEAAVYERFGKRTGTREYIRLGMLLAQNLKKGNQTLLDRLREEAARAYGEQIQNSRRLAEEASTKLLFPMVLMLVVVMLMVMIPAFSSMGM